MGTTIILLCDNCNYEKEFFVGFGLYGIENIIKNNSRNGVNDLSSLIRDEEQRNFLLNVLKEKDISFKIDEERLFLCEYCNTIDSKYYYLVEYENKKHEIKYSCHKCKHELKMLYIDWLNCIYNQPVKVYSDNQEIKLKCPNCLSDNLKCVGGCFDWD